LEHMGWTCQAGRRVGSTPLALKAAEEELAGAFLVVDPRGFVQDPEEPRVVRRLRGAAAGTNTFPGRVGHSEAICTNPLKQSVSRENKPNHPERRQKGYTRLAEEPPPA